MGKLYVVVLSAVFAVTVSCQSNLGSSSNSANTTNSESQQEDFIDSLMRGIQPGLNIIAPPTVPIGDTFEVIIEGASVADAQICVLFHSPVDPADPPSLEEFDFRSAEHLRITSNNVEFTAPTLPQALMLVVGCATRDDQGDLVRLGGLTIVSIFSANTTTNCNDGIDNDLDGAIDLYDLSCIYGGPSESTMLSQCQDGINNDGDNSIDFPSDPGCSNNQDNDETNRTITHPSMFMSQDEIDETHDHMQSNDEPWISARNSLVSRADGAMAQSDCNVLGSGGGNIFTTSSNDDRQDYSCIHRMNQNARTLAMAYMMTGSTSYANRALNIIRTWMVDPTTMMIPNQFQTHSTIQILITVPGFMYAIDLLWNYSGWQSGEKQAVQNWAQSIANYFRGAFSTCPLVFELPDDPVCDAGDDYDNVCPENCSWSVDKDCVCNNWENWRLMLIATSAHTAGNVGMLEYTFEQQKSMVPHQINQQGQLIYEMTRSVTFTYFAFSLEGMILLAEIAKQQGVDLYNYQENDGRGLRMVVDYFAPYAANPNTWPFTQTASHGANESMAMFELVYKKWHQPVYLDATNQWGRPAYSMWTTGDSTMSHGVQ